MKMEDNGPRYINPLTDFGFKRIFGTPFNKDLLIVTIQFRPSFL